MIFKLKLQKRATENWKSIMIFLSAIFDKPPMIFTKKLYLYFTVLELKKVFVLRIKFMKG